MSEVYRRDCGCIPDGKGPCMHVLRDWSEEQNWSHKINYPSTKDKQRGMPDPS